MRIPHQVRDDVTDVARMTLGCGEDDVKDVAGRRLRMWRGGGSGTLAKSAMIANMQRKFCRSVCKNGWFCQRILFFYLVVGKGGGFCQRL